LQVIYSQEDVGVVALNIPIRNSMTFNRFAIQPTFSFVRESSKYFSVYAKREAMEFDNAPLTYLASYSGRFRENIGAGLAVFQQNYGVLTTFGGVLNVAYNARMGVDENLTFGLNIGAYKSGLNSGAVVTNFDDPSLQNIPDNFILTVSPGVNYGFEFVDFGISVNNLVAYNFKSSALIEDNPEQTIQAHLMYTGYMRSRGFFDDSKFSGLVKAEFKNDDTIFSGLAMLTVPRGVWAQVGYNTLYGASGGLGLNITKSIAIEYNYEMPFGDLSEFGASHTLAFAYRFKNRERYEYTTEDDIAGLIEVKKKSKPKSKPTVAKTKTEAEAQAKLLAEQKIKEETEGQSEPVVAKSPEEAEAQLKRLRDEQAKKEAEAKLLAEQKAKEEAEAQARLLAEQKAKEEAEAQAKLLAEQKAKEEAEAQARLLAEQKAKEEAEAQARLLAEQKAKEEAEAQAKLLAEQKIKEETEGQSEPVVAKSPEEAEAQLKRLREEQAKKKAEQENKQEEVTIQPNDKVGKALQNLEQQADADKETQKILLEQLDAIVISKDKDLKDLKEDNDRSEQGLAVKPRPFKSITAENNKLNQIKSDLDNTIKKRNKKIEELEALYDDLYEADTLYNDEVILYYKKSLKRLKSEQIKAVSAKAQLETRLAEIKIATDFERRRRIKRAAFDNEEERYDQDRATLDRLKKTTVIRSQPLSPEDFDTGEPQSNNIQILKNVNNTEEGIYVVIAVHTDTSKRDEFLTKAIASGATNVDFFYDVKTSKYYIYQAKYDSISAANNAIKSNNKKPYNKNMSLVKIEN
jgi:type IX secretion system PorP/SprF family membrane protein